MLTDKAIKTTIPFAFRLAWFWIVAGLILAANMQLLMAFPLAFIVPSYFNRIARSIARLLWPGLVWSFEILNGNKVTFYGTALPESEHAIVIANHQYHCDWLVVFALAARLRAIAGVRVIAKGIIRYAPFVGTVLSALGFVFLSRSWQNDKSKLDQAFRSLKTSSEPYWLISHPEGTRLTPQKLAESNAFGAKQGYAPTKHILLPRVKGFASSVGALRGSAKAVYDLTIAYRSKPGGWVALFTGTLLCFLSLLIGGFISYYGLQFTHRLFMALGLVGRPTEVQVYVRRYDMKDVPTDEEELKKWLFKLYEEKDQLLETYHRTGKFPGQPILVETATRVSTANVFSGILKWVLSFIPFGLVYLAGVAYFFLKH